MKNLKKYLLIIAMLIVSILLIINHFGLFQPKTVKFDVQQAKLVDVNEKNIFIFKDLEKNKEIKIALIGVEIPRMPKQIRPYDSWTIAQYLKQTYCGEVFHLKYGILSKKLGNGVSNAYVYIDENKMLQEELLSRGHATVFCIPPDDRFENQFIEKQKLGMNEKLGIWADRPQQDGEKVRVGPDGRREDEGHVVYGEAYKPPKGSESAMSEEELMKMIKESKYKGEENSGT